MNPNENRDAISVLAEVLELAPDIRLGQLFAHIGFLGEALVGKKLADLEDDEVMNVLLRHRNELVARTESASSQVV